MKKLYIFLAVVNLAFTLECLGQFYDGFTGTGNIGGNCSDASCNSNGWYTHSNTKPGTIDIISGSLTYPNLVSSTGNKVYIIGDNINLPRDVNAAVNISGTVAYFSALINVIDNTNLNTTSFNYFLHFATSSGNSGVTVFPCRLGIKQGNGTSYRLGIMNNTGGVYSESTTDLIFGTTTLVVAKFDITTNKATLWVNPTSLGGAEPAGFIENTSSSATVNTIASICIRNAYDATNLCGSPKAEIDEIRVGETFASVTPSNQFVPVSSITVNGSGGVTSITTNAGTLQMIANVLPVNASNPNVSWSVINSTGEASIDSFSGLLTAISNGVVTVVAEATDGSGISGNRNITISNQTTFGTDTLTLMHYNILNFGVFSSSCDTINNNPNQKAIHFRTIFQHVKPDILGVNEMSTSPSYHQKLLDESLNGNGISYYQKTPATNYASSSIINMLYYNSQKVGFISNTGIDIGTRDANIYKLYHKYPDLVTTHDTTFIYYIIAHLKAGTTQNDYDTRANETSFLMNYLETNYQNSNFILTGDLNLYDSNEQAFQNLINYPNTSYRFNDPILNPSVWDGTDTYSNFHTQSPHLVSNNCSAGGGLDNRFDFILTSNSIQNGSQNVISYPSTYKTVGQDGLHHDDSLNALPTNVSAPSNVIEALMLASDHLPVTMKLGITHSGASVIPVTSITVSGQGGINQINTANGTLQMIATVLPINATNQTVSWGGVGISCQASIDQNGLLTANGNGQVFVTATANDGSGISGSCFVTVSAQPTSDFFYDGFVSLGNIGGDCTDASCNNNGWYTHSNNKPATIDIIPGNLSYPGLQNSIGNKAYISGNTMELSRDVNAALPSPITNIAYFSALIKIIDATNLSSTGFDYFMHFGDTSGNAVTGFSGRLGIKSVNSASQYRFGLMNGANGSYSEYYIDLDFGNTYLVVVKYNISTKEASLWLNPSTLGGVEPSSSVTNNSSTASITKVASICIRNGYNTTNAGGTPKAEIDEVRIGSSFAAVTPSIATDIEADKLIPLIYPTFFDSYIVVDINKTGKYMFQILSMDGRIVQKGEFSDGSFTIDTRSIISGLYVIFLSNTNGEFISKQKIMKY